MGKHLLLLALLISGSSFGAVTVDSEAYGSGTPGTMTEQAKVVDGNAGVYHVPQYLPLYPTAASIWPRVIEVPCEKVNGDLKCAGYSWTPEMGRAEYLFIKPIVREKPVVLVPKEIIKEVIKEVPVLYVPVLKEVVPKKKLE